MPYTQINKSTDYFNTKIYTGNGATQALTGIGHAPDAVWLKSRGDNDGHKLFDKVRGALKVIEPNDSATESTYASSLTSFDSDGFTLGSTGDVNDTGDTFVSWSWKAGGAGSANTDGSQSSTVSVNTTAGFSIVKFVNNQSYTTNTFGHGLGVVPQVIMMRSLDDAYNWDVYHHKVVNSKRLVLNNNGTQSNSTYMNSTSPTNQVFTLKSDHYGSGSNAIAYCFASKTGFSKFGSYIASNGQSHIYTGFKPKWVMIKRTDSADNWKILDSERSTFNIMNETLSADNSGAEATETDVYVDFLSNGIRLDGSNGAIHANQGSYVYMAFAAAPLVGSNNIPCTAR